MITWSVIALNLVSSHKSKYKYKSRGYAGVDCSSSESNFSKGDEVRLFPKLISPFGE